MASKKKKDSERSYAGAKRGPKKKREHDSIMWGFRANDDQTDWYNRIGFTYGPKSQMLNTAVECLRAQDDGRPVPLVQVTDEALETIAQELESLGGDLPELPFLEVKARLKWAVESIRALKRDPGYRG